MGSGIDIESVVLSADRRRSHEATPCLKHDASHEMPDPKERLYMDTQIDAYAHAQFMVASSCYKY